MNNEINLKSLLTSLSKHVTWLIMIPIVCASVMFAVLSFEESTYTANVDFLSKNITKTVDYNTSTLQNAKKAEIPNYEKILTSDTTLKPVSERLAAEYGMSVSIQEIRSMITTTVPEGTAVMSVIVTSSSPKLAENICQLISEVLVPVVEKSYDKENILECVSNEFKAVENKPDLIKPTIVVAAAGFIAVFVVCFFIAYNDKTLRTAEEAKKMLEIPVIGVVPR